jgi:hypothetical protein
MTCHNARQPKNLRFILESTDNDNNEDFTHPAPKKTRIHKTKTANHFENEVESHETEKQKEKSDDEELGKSINLLIKN